jgi:hypothetical protein
MNFPDLKILALIGRDVQPVLKEASSAKIERIVLRTLGVGEAVENHLIDGMLL